jgi:hypothetical protein
MMSGSRPSGPWRRHQPRVTAAKALQDGKVDGFGPTAWAPSRGPARRRHHVLGRRGDGPACFGYTMAAAATDALIALARNRGRGGARDRQNPARLRIDRATRLLDVGRKRFPPPKPS